MQALRGCGVADGEGKGLTEGVLGVSGGCGWSVVCVRLGVGAAVGRGFLRGSRFRQALPLGGLWGG